jgi:hypothetical protein
METLPDPSLNIAIRSAVFHLPGGELAVLAAFGGAEQPAVAAIVALVTACLMSLRRT